MIAMDVLMPQLGETVAEGTITHWFKAVGDQVASGENLFEIETDKATMEVPATAAGKLAEIRVPVGTIAPVGAVVAVIADGTTARQRCITGTLGDIVERVESENLRPPSVVVIGEVVRLRDSLRWFDR